MSDFNSQLPIRSKDDIDERVLIKLQDGNEPSGINRTTEVSERKLHVRNHGVDENEDDRQLRLNVNGNVTIANSDGTAIDSDSPLAVYQAESPADEIDEFNESVDTVVNESANHNYIVSSGKFMSGVEARCAASGRAKFDLQLESSAGSGEFASVAVGFNSTAAPNVELKYTKKVSAGVTVRIIKTNLDTNPQDLYSQIIGKEI